MMIKNYIICRLNVYLFQINLLKLHRISGTLFPDRRLRNWAMYLTLVDQKLQEVGVHSLTKEQLKRVCPHMETEKS